VNEKMPKAIYVAPPLNTADIPPSGATVTIKEVRIIKDQWTSIGTCSLGLGLTVELDGELYSQMFSLDRPVLTGSIGRLLVSIGLTEVSQNTPENEFQKLIGKQATVIKKGGKIYWYPK
jgi:hypothetical protein